MPSAIPIPAARVTYQFAPRQLPEKSTEIVAIPALLAIIVGAAGLVLHDRGMAGTGLIFLRQQPAEHVDWAAGAERHDQREWPLREGGRHRLAPAGRAGITAADASRVMTARRVTSVAGAGLTCRSWSKLASRL